MKKFLLAAICMLLVGFSSRATAVGDVNGDIRVRCGGCLESFATDCRNTNRDW